MGRRRIAAFGDLAQAAFGDPGWLPVLAQDRREHRRSLLASIAYFLLAHYHFHNRTVFLVGVLPALLVFWIRRAVPEPEEWRSAKSHSAAQPAFFDLFRSPVRRTTMLTLLVCSPSRCRGTGPSCSGTCNTCAASGNWKAGATPTRASWSASRCSSRFLRRSPGTFWRPRLAHYLKYRRAIVGICLAYAASMFATYAVPLSLEELWIGIVAIGLCQERLRAVHHVHAAAFSNAVAHDGRRLLLQLRPDRGWIWHRVLRPLHQGRRLSRGLVLCGLSLPSGSGNCSFAARTAGRVGSMKRRGDYCVGAAFILEGVP